MNYYYLVSSLPYLQLEGKIPFSEKTFISMCSDLLPSKLLEELKRVSMLPSSKHCCISEYQWNAFETNLRNWCVHIRTHKTSHDPIDFLREDLDIYATMERDIEAAYDSATPLITEKKLDLLRWQELDNIKSTHEFDFDVLFIYKIRLLLMGKWQELEKENGQKELDSLVEGVLAKKL